MKYSIQIYINVFLLFSLIFTSCTDLLEENPKGFIAPKEFYKTVDQCQDAVNGCYMPLNSIYRERYLLMLEASTDLAFQETVEDTKFMISPATPGIGFTIWNNCYLGIMRCNSVLEGIATSPIKEDSKPRLAGETVYLRALYYYILTSTFNNVPFYTFPVNTLDAIDRVSNIGRIDADEIRSYLIEELKQYVTALPDKEIQDTDNYQRITSQAARMLIAKIAMWNKDYNTAMEHLLELRDYYGSLNRYSLEDTYFSAKNRPESIFEIQYTWSATGIKKTTQVACFFTPSKVKDKAVYDGLLIPELGEKLTRYTSVIPTRYFTGLYSESDPRREIILAYHYGGSSSNHMFNQPKSGKKPWMGPKFWCFGMDNNSDGNNQKVFRYADALLMLAECANEIENRDVDLALSCLNEVKSRAGQRLFRLTGKEEVFNEIKDERARELMGEYGRKYDLVRWNIFYESVSTTSGTESNYVKNNLRPYHRYYPIPDSEIIKSKGILNNDEYNQGMIK